MATQSLTSNLPQTRPRKPPNSAPRSSESRQVRKLTENLLNTYREINDAYYKKKQERNKEKDSQKDTEFEIKEGQVLNGRYRVQNALGKGSFGQVVRAVDLETQGKVAVKIIRARSAFRIQAKTEIQLLELLSSLDPDDKWCIVRLKQQFEHEGHTCLVFEQLSFNLYELLHRTRFHGVSLNLVRKFARQMLKTLAFLSLPDVDVIHCDLKPENILLRVSNRSALKVIDFGSSCTRTKQMYVYIQSRFYRSPEVILGLPYSQAIDMWSLGCILVELHVGTPLFAGEDEHDQMIRFAALKGRPPTWMLEKGKKTAKFFDVYSPRISPGPGSSVRAGPADAAAATALRAGRARRRGRAAAAGWHGYKRAMAPAPEKPAAEEPGKEEEEGGKKEPAVSKVPLSREQDWPAREVPVEFDSDEDEQADPESCEWLADPGDEAAAGQLTPSVNSSSGGAQHTSGGSISGASQGRVPSEHQGSSRPSQGAFVATGSGAEQQASAARLRRAAAHARRLNRLRRPAKDSHRGVVQYKLKPRNKPSTKRSSKVTRVHSSLAELLGARSGGPGGRRADEKDGHTTWHYLQFMDMVNRMLEYDPHVRITPMQALNHPFLREDNPPGWDPTSPENRTEASAPPAAAAAAGGGMPASMPHPHAGGSSSVPPAVPSSAYAASVAGYHAVQSGMPAQGMPMQGHLPMAPIMFAPDQSGVQQGWVPVHGMPYAGTAAAAQTVPGYSLPTLPHAGTHSMPASQGAASLPVGMQRGAVPAGPHLPHLPQGMPPAQYAQEQAPGATQAAPTSQGQGQ